MKRVVITGSGVISPVGNTVEEFWNSLKDGVCGIDYITKFDATNFKVKTDAEVKNFDPKNYFDSVQEIRKTDVFIQYAYAAAKEAMEKSGLTDENIDKNRLGVYIGTGIGGIYTIMNETRKLDDRGPDRVSPFFVPMMIANMASGLVSIKYGAKGPTLPIVTACATSSHAIGEAYRAIKHGYADAIIAGGTESAINELAMAGFVNCQALSLAETKEDACMPFDARRKGFVMGEGAGVIVVEEYEHAVNRGANIIAEIVGYGNTADAYHMTAPDPSAQGAYKAVKDAIEEAGLDMDSEIYVNAHGTSTHLNDVMETTAFKMVFGDKASKLHISSTKSMTGHMLGAAGAVECIASAYALKDGVVPPTINYKEPDPECDLDYTPNVKKEVALDYAISTSLGFGGHNACLVLKKFN